LYCGSSQNWNAVVQSANTEPTLPEQQLKELLGPGWSILRAALSLRPGVAGATDARGAYECLCLMSLLVRLDSCQRLTSLATFAERVHRAQDRNSSCGYSPVRTYRSTICNDWLRSFIVLLVFLVLVILQYTRQSTQQQAGKCQAGGVHCQSCAFGMLRP
jgi:hypothetical protein